MGLEDDAALLCDDWNQEEEEEGQEAEVQERQDEQSLRAELSLPRKVLGVEVAIALHAFSSGLHGVIFTNLMIDKVCSVNLNFSAEVCNNIQAHDEEQVRPAERILTSSMESGC